MQLHWHSYKSLALCLWIRYANENINLYRKMYFLQMSWAQMMMMMFISCHMQDGRLHSDWKIQNCGWEPLFKSFGQLTGNFCSIGFLYCIPTQFRAWSSASHIWDHKQPGNPKWIILMIMNEYIDETLSSFFW